MSLLLHAPAPKGSDLASPRHALGASRPAGDGRRRGTLEHRRGTAPVHDPGRSGPARGTLIHTVHRCGSDGAMRAMRWPGRGAAEDRSPTRGRPSWSSRRPARCAGPPECRGDGSEASARRADHLDVPGRRVRPSARRSPPASRNVMTEKRGGGAGQSPGVRTRHPAAAAVSTQAETLTGTLANRACPVTRRATRRTRAERAPRASGHLP